MLGYVLQIFAVPVAPLLTAFILGPPFEEALRQALVGSEGSPAIFFTHPTALFFMVLTAHAVWLTASRARRAGMPAAGSRPAALPSAFPDQPPPTAGGGHPAPTGSAPRTD